MRKLIRTAAVLAVGLLTASCQTVSITSPSDQMRTRLMEAGFLPNDGAFVCSKARCGDDAAVAFATAPISMPSGAQFTAEEMIKSGNLDANELRKRVQAIEDAKPSDRHTYSSLVIDKRTAGIIVATTFNSGGEVWASRGRGVVRGNSFTAALIVSKDPKVAARYAHLARVE